MSQNQGAEPPAETGQQVLRVRELWEGSSFSQRAMILGMVVACLAVAGLVVAWARQPHYGMLYTGLEKKEAADIVDRLRDENVPLKLEDGGTTILVPSERIYEIRLKMASQGLPKGGQAGYSILDKQQVGTSPFKQRVNYTRAVAGELSQSIQLIEGVRSARVHIVRPKSSVFVGDEKEASATAVLDMGGGNKLPPGKVAAIVNLVAGGVKGLASKDVVVVDSAGNLLSGSKGEASKMQRAGTIFDQKQRLEEYLSEKAENMLAQVLGPNRASVKVNATLGMSSITESSTTYDPDQRAVKKEETTVKTETERGGDGGDGGSESRKEDIVEEYLVSQNSETTQKLPGRVEDLQAAAMVDLRGEEEAGDDGEPPAGQPIEVEDVRQIVSKAVGIEDPSTVKVVDAPFVRPDKPSAAPEKAAPFWRDRDFLLELGGRISLGLLVIGALIALLFFRRRGGRAGQGASESPAMAAIRSGESNEIRPDLLRQQISQALEENPDEVKRLFVNWVNPEKERA